MEGVKSMQWAVAKKSWPGSPFKNRSGVVSIEDHIASFLTTVAADPRIRAAHISLYAALLYEWQQQGFTAPFCISRQPLMRAAKIRSRHTYNVVINELKEYGYIGYQPSADPAVPGKVIVHENTCTK